MLNKVKTRHWDVARCTYAQLLDQMGKWLCDGESHYVCFCDGNGMPRAWNGDLYLRKAYKNADAVCADGIALDWLARICGGRSARLTGPKLFVEALKYGTTRGWRHYLYGTNEETLSDLKMRLEGEIPGVNIVGTFAPDFAEDPVPPPIVNGGIDILWVALGCPKQEKWCAKHKDELGIPILMPVGAAFDFYSGKAAKTPEWIVNIGLCWLWRLCTGGRRVLVRNIRCVSASILILAKELLRIKLLREDV